MKKLSKEIYFVNNIVVAAQNLTDYLDTAFDAAQEIWTALPGNNDLVVVEIKNSHAQLMTAVRKNIDEIRENFQRYESSETKPKELKNEIFEPINKFYHNQINLMSNLHNLIVEVNNTQPPSKTLRVDLTAPQDIPSIKEAATSNLDRFFTNDVLRPLVDMLDLHVRNFLETVEICVIRPQAKRLTKGNASSRRHGRYKFEVKTKGDMLKLNLEGNSMSGISTYPQDGLVHELDIIRGVTEAHKSQAERIVDALTAIRTALENEKNSREHGQGNE